MRKVLQYATLSALVFFSILPQAAFTQTQWSEGYWTGDNGVPISSIEWDALTHVDYVSMQANSDGSLEYLCGGSACSESDIAPQAQALVSLAHANGVKVIAEVNCCGDWSSATNSTNLPTFVSNIMQFVNAYGMDGVSLDWENGPYNFTQIENLLSLLRTNLGSKLIVVTVVAEYSNAAHFASLQSYVDRYNVMSYDQGGRTPTWFNCPLYNDAGGYEKDNSGSVNLDVAGVLMAGGVAASKINASIAFYGEVQSGATGPRQNVSVSTSQINYNRIVANYPSQYASPNFDSVARVPWFASGNSWVNFDNAQSISEKINYAIAKNLGGWFIWALDQDYFPSQTPTHPLLAAVAAAIEASSYTAPSITSTSPLAAGIVGTAYSLTVSASGTTPMTWAITSGALPSGLSLDPSSGVISGTPTLAGVSSFTVEASNAAGNSSMQFSLTVNPVATSLWYNVISKNSGLCLDVVGNLTIAGATLDQWPCSGANQSFQFTPVQGGYAITAQNSGLQLDVEGALAKDGTPIIQYPFWGGTNEIWNFVPNLDGSYAITVLSSGECMSVAGSSTTAAAVVHEWQCLGVAAQQWSLVPVQ